MEKIETKNINKLTLDDFLTYGEQTLSDDKASEWKVKRYKQKLASMANALKDRVVLTNEGLAKLMTAKTGKLWKVCDIHELLPNLDPTGLISSYYAICETNKNFNVETSTCKLKAVRKGVGAPILKYEIEGLSNSPDCTRIGFSSVSERNTKNGILGYDKICGNTNWFLSYAIKKFGLEYGIGFLTSGIKGAKIPKNEVGELIFQVLDEYFLAEREKLVKEHAQDDAAQDETSQS